jgi:hypothetical protein
MPPKRLKLMSNLIHTMKNIEEIIMNELDIVVAWIVCGAVAICGLCTNNIEAVVTLVLPIIMYMICVR